MLWDFAFHSILPAMPPLPDTHGLQAPSWFRFRPLTPANDVHAHKQSRKMKCKWNYKSAYWIVLSCTALHMYRCVYIIHVVIYIYICGVDSLIVFCLFVAPCDVCASSYYLSGVEAERINPFLRPLLRCGCAIEYCAQQCEVRNNRFLVQKLQIIRDLRKLCDDEVERRTRDRRVKWNVRLFKSASVSLQTRP